MRRLIRSHQSAARSHLGMLQQDTCDRCFEANCGENCIEARSRSKNSANQDRSRTSLQCCQVRCTRDEAQQVRYEVRIAKLRHQECTTSKVLQRKPDGMPLPACHVIAVGVLSHTIGPRETMHELENCLVSNEPSDLALKASNCNTVYMKVTWCPAGAFSHQISGSELTSVISALEFGIFLLLS